jgi:pseudaminic acid biosynthesis-associated methylase
MSFNSEQEQFWAKTYADEYISKNLKFDQPLGVSAWAGMLAKIAPGEIQRYLECGCNVGRNIEQVSAVLPAAKASIIEISEPAFRYVTSKYPLEHTFNGPILDSQFSAGQFDLVFTMGVLIHINPSQLIDHMEKMFTYASKYILIGEYFHRTPVMIEYQGEKDRLFKRDFGKLFIENFSVKLVDYGFLWGHIYDNAGFDDITWWLFEKVDNLVLLKKDS